MKKLFVAFFLVAILLVSIEAASIKISLDEDDHFDIWSEALGEVCENKKEVQASSLTMKYLKELAAMKDGSHFYNSTKGTEMMNAIVKKEMADTKKNSADTFLKFIRSLGCQTYIYGGAARDTLLMETDIKDIDAETDCKLEKIFDKCKQKFGADLCYKGGRYPASLMNFGTPTHSQEMVDLAISTETLQIKENYNLEYTPNAVAYDYGGDNVFIGLSEHSIDDVCNMKIRIPVKETKVERDKWAAARKDKVGKKIFRYWKLIMKGFSPEGSSKTQDYIIAKAKEIRDAYDDWKPMKSYFCHIMYNTKALKEYENEKKVKVLACDLTKEQCLANLEGRKKATKFAKGIVADIGWEPPSCGDPKNKYV